MPPIIDMSSAIPKPDATKLTAEVWSKCLLITTLTIALFDEAVDIISAFRRHRANYHATSYERGRITSRAGILSMLMAPGLSSTPWRNAASRRRK